MALPHMAPLARGVSFRMVGFRRFERRAKVWKTKVSRAAANDNRGRAEKKFTSERKKGA